MPFSIVRGQIVRDNTGASVEMPVLLASSGGTDDVPVPVISLVDYILSMPRSLAWQEKLVRGAKKFLEYCEANANPVVEEWRLFRNFSSALRNGTIDPETGTDPSGLYWEGIGSDANVIIMQLSNFFDWMGHEDGSRVEKFNPHHTGNAYDQRIDMQAYRYRRDKAFLGHAWSGKPKETFARLTRGERTPKVFPKRPPAFPEEHFEELLFKGFKVGGQHDYRGMLISLLQFGGGLRVSEPFHLFMADVQPHWDNSNRAFIAVHHPSLGYAPNHWRNCAGQRGSRREYLAADFGLTPRHLVRSKLNAGWKHPALDDRWFMQVHWFPEVYGEWFMQIWLRYLEQVQAITRNHPYAWINIYQKPHGGIYTIDQYSRALENAVERIGLVPGKSYGTTAHGFRHAFGQRARRGGIHEVIIQRLMHHCSPESQLIYTQPELAESQAAIRQATQKLNETRASMPSLRVLTSKLET